MNKQQFYKSAMWETFRRIIIDERTNDDGYVMCSICGKPILKKYDLIVHHVKELDDVNVNDATIALNPDNVECVHFKCHNEIHERFGYHKTGYSRPKKNVYIVYGAPCSGKSTWVRGVATENDLVVDMDSIYQMISVNERYAKPDALRGVAFDVRDKLYDIAKYRSGNWCRAYIVAGCPTEGERTRLMARVGADDAIFIDTPESVCLERLRERQKGKDYERWAEYIHDWFEKCQNIPPMPEN